MGCVKQFIKYTIIMRPHFDLFGDRFSECPKEEFRAKIEEVNRVNGTANVELSCIVSPL